MKNGFKEKIVRILKNNGLKSTGVIGTILSNGTSIRKYLISQGFNVEDGINNPTYDYIVIGKSKASLVNLKKALTRTNYGGIIIISDGKILYFTRKEKNLYEIKS